MDIVTSYYQKIFNNYVYIIQRYPFWLLAVLGGILVIGVIVALCNRPKHNAYVWLLPVIMLPVFGSVAVIAAAIVLQVLKKKKNIIPKSYTMNRSRIVMTGIFTVAAVIFVNYFRPGNFPYINEAFVAGVPVLCIMISYLATMRSYSREARYIHIVKLDQSQDKIDHTAGNFSYFADPASALPTLREMTAIKNMYFESYIPFYEGGWQYVTAGIDGKFAFDCYTEDDFRAHFDAISAEYAGKGINKIKAYKWFYSDDYGVVLRNGHVKDRVIPSDRHYEEYDGSEVHEVVLYRCQQSPVRLIVETVEMITMVFFLVTPLGTMIHNSILELIISILDNFF